MLNTIFDTIFTTTNESTSIAQFLLCIAVSLLLGFFFAIVYRYKNHATQSFLITLALLPATVCAVILMVNGNVGAGVAVAGAFSLVRFRSIPGNARDIGTIFLAMAAGLMTGMGYLGYAVLFSVILGLVMVILTQTGFGMHDGSDADKTLRITIPEDLNYSNVFDDLFAQYTTSCKLISVKTTNMGSMFKLQYHLTLADPSAEKAFIDALRCRNGNLEISIARQEANTYELEQYEITGSHTRLFLTGMQHLRMLGRYNTHNGIYGDFHGQFLRGNPSGFR